MRDVTPVFLVLCVVAVLGERCYIIVGTSSPMKFLRYVKR